MGYEQKRRRRYSWDYPDRPENRSLTLRELAERLGADEVARMVRDERGFMERGDGRDPKKQ